MNNKINQEEHNQVACLACGCGDTFHAEVHLLIQPPLLLHHLYLQLPALHHLPPAACCCLRFSFSISQQAPQYIVPPGSFSHRTSNFLSSSTKRRTWCDVCQPWLLLPFSSSVSMVVWKSMSGWNMTDSLMTKLIWSETDQSFYHFHSTLLS